VDKLWKLSGHISYQKYGKIRLEKVAFFSFVTEKIGTQCKALVLRLKLYVSLSIQRQFNKYSGSSKIAAVQKIG
jgi:hypothetical protein